MTRRSDSYSVIEFIVNVIYEIKFANSQWQFHADNSGAENRGNFVTNSPDRRQQLLYVGMSDESFLLILYGQF